MQGTRRPWLTLAVLTVALAALRTIWILQVPDVDMDAYGHFTIARSLCANPWNLAVHWVWLPLYHFLLTALACTQTKFVFARLLSTCAIAALPIATYYYDARGTAERKRTAFVAAIVCALTTIPNAIGVSAQQESLFSLAILAAAWAIDARRFYAAGALLAAACLIRYEAWGAAGLVVAQPVLVRLTRCIPRAPAWFRSLEPLHVAVALPPVAVIVAWIVLHRLVDGTWLGFLDELYRYTYAQRRLLSHGALMDAVWFPILVPFIAFGPLVALAPFGVSRALQRGWILPIGIYGFLMTSYLGHGVLGGERYYGSLAPFICILMAHGSDRLARQAWLRRFAAPVLMATVIVATSVNFVRLRRAAHLQAAVLTAAEQRMNAVR